MHKKRDLINKCLPISVAKYKTNKTIVVSKLSFILCKSLAMGTDLAHFDIFYNVKVETCFRTEDFYRTKIFFGPSSIWESGEVSVVYDQSIAIFDLM